MDKSVIKSVKDVLQVGKTQNKTFVEERCELVSKPVSWISYLCLTHLKLRDHQKQKRQISALKNENHPWPPSLSNGGKLRQGTESDLLKCLDKIAESVANAPDVDMKVIDGAESVHMLNPDISMTFSDYTTNVFISYCVGYIQTWQLEELHQGIQRNMSTPSCGSSSSRANELEEIPSGEWKQNWTVSFRGW